MERRVVFISERACSSTVAGIQRIDSQSMSGIGILKVYFEPGSDIGGAIAQIVSVSLTASRIMPPGITPPSIIRYNASNVPVAQLTISSKTLSEQELYDYGLNFIRLRLFTIPGLATPAPFGGKSRQIMVDFDPSVFVRAAIKNVLHEAVIASILVSLMILFFLGSWRGAVLVGTSIPLAILVGLVGLFLSGQTLNLMTLGGLALAIGMLVDDATAGVENIHRNRHIGKPLTVAILDGARQIAVPALAATLTICVVFFPVVLLEGPARFLFTPLALGVVISMLASYLLSRTLVPTLARILMEKEDLDHKGPGFSARFNRWRDAGFGRFREAYARMLSAVLAHRGLVLGAAGLVLLCTATLPFVVGLDFFPTVDAGQMRLHYRAPIGTRVEETERQVAQLEDRIREIVPPEELETINANIGLPVSYNLAFVQTDNTGSQDAEILVALKPDHAPTERYMDRIRRELPDQFPG